MKKDIYRNIPIFLPELACKNKCVFCNQSSISGQENIIQAHEVSTIIDTYLSTIQNAKRIQLAFFGGSFTGLPLETQIEYLKIAQPYIANNQIHSIRISTRPDYITKENLDKLQAYHVQDIELGAQSTNNQVLALSGRGHTYTQIIEAANLINQYGFTLGLQMMIGLPGDTQEKCLQTAKDIVALQAKTTRIYPTLVIANTQLAHMYQQGLYTPLTLENAIEWTKPIYRYFESNHVTILRTGLHPNSEFNSNSNVLLAGPYHPSYKELVLSSIWKDIIEQSIPITEGNITIEVSPTQINFAIGHNSKNKNNLFKQGITAQFKANNKLKQYAIEYSNY